MRARNFIIFMYYDYTVEVRNGFKGLDLTECLMNYGQRFMTLYRRQGSRPSPWKRNAKSKMAVWGEICPYLTLIPFQNAKIKNQACLSFLNCASC